MDAIVYTSNTGFTAKYAAMLAKKTGMRVYELKSAKNELAAGTPVVYMGWVFAGMVKGLKKAMKRYDVKAVCAVGMMPPTEELRAQEREGNKVPANIGFFTLAGGCDLNRLHGFNKKLLSMVTGKTVSELRAKPERTKEEDARIEMLLNGFDHTSEAALEPVIEYIKTV